MLGYCEHGPWTSAPLSSDFEEPYCDQGSTRTLMVGNRREWPLRRLAAGGGGAALLVLLCLSAPALFWRSGVSRTPWQSGSSEVLASTVDVTKGLCPYSVLGGCLEKGRPDKDCCALPGEGTCEESYDFLYGQACNKDGTAVATCCKKKPIHHKEEKDLRVEARADHSAREAKRKEAPEAKREEKLRKGGKNETRDWAKGKCPFPVLGGCMERGRMDRDCCARKGLGSCAAGYRFSVGAVCWPATQAVTTCCEREEATTTAAEDWAKGKCPFPVLGGCMERGHLDRDCCALKGLGSCAAGYHYSVGAVCWPKTHAVTTCCKLEESTTTTTATATPTTTTTAETTTTTAEKDASTTSVEAGHANATEEEATTTAAEEAAATTTEEANATLEENTTTTTATTTTVPMDNGTFCWLVTQSSGDEAALVRDHFASARSVFSCDSWSVFTDKDRLKPVPVTNIGALNSTWAPWGSWYNTEVFLRAWRVVVRQGKYARHAWMLKVDADTVFFPQRLHLHTRELDPKKAWYFKTSQGLLGALEVFSHGAVRAFAEHGRKTCIYGIKKSGEDGWFDYCMRELKAEVKWDDSMLKTTHQPGVCGDPQYVAFHPFKTVDVFANCHTIGAQQHVVVRWK